MKRVVILLAFALVGCATQPTANEVYTETKAAEQMESFVRAHAALSNVDAGPLQTQCEMLEKLDESEANEYACATLVKNQNVVLEADCSIDLGCEATGYKVWDAAQGKFVEPNPKMSEVPQ